MEHETLLDQAIHKIDYTFRFVGICLESSRRKVTPNTKYRLLFWSNFIWTNIDVAGAIYWLIDNASKGASFTQLTYGVPCVTMCLLSDSRALYCLLYSTQISELLSTLRSLELKQMRSQNYREKKKMVDEETKSLFSVLKYLSVSNWVLFISFPLMPLCIIAYEYYQSNQLNLQLLYYVKYPFDAYDIKYWPYAFVRQIWIKFFFILRTCPLIWVRGLVCVGGVCFAAIVIFIISGTDYFYCICLTSICLQFKLLQFEIKKSSEARGGWERSELVKLVVWHLQLIRCVDLMEIIYSKSTLFNILASSLVICMTGFNVTEIKDIPLVVLFLSFLFMGLAQIFVFCYFGDRLMRSSTDVSHAIYNSKWYSGGTAMGRYLHFIQTRAQKPCKITAYGFLDINLLAFTKVLSTAWSYFALLKTVYSPPRA